MPLSGLTCKASLAGEGKTNLLFLQALINEYKKKTIQVAYLKRYSYKPPSEIVSRRRLIPAEDTVTLSRMM